MQGIFFEDLTIGQSAETMKIVGAADVEAFAAVSGDTNPVHLDEAYAMIAADAKATKRIGCHDWGFTPWFAENCIVFEASSEHFLCVTPYWKTRVENYILELSSHDEND